MRAVKGHVTLLAATALALGLAACSSMEGPNALLTQQEAQSVADVVVADAASLADAASYNAASGVPMASAPAHLRPWPPPSRAAAPGSINSAPPRRRGGGTTGAPPPGPRGDGTSSLFVTTTPPLHYNADCTVAPKFDAGTISAVVTRSSGMTTITVQFTACGQYTVTRS